MKGSSVVLGSWEVAICYEDKNISVVNNTMLSAWLALFSLRQVSTDCGSVHSVLYTGVWSLYTGLYTAAKVAPEETERSFLPFTHPPPTPGQARLHSPHQYHSLPHSCPHSPHHYLSLPHIHPSLSC